MGEAVHIPDTDPRSRCDRNDLCMRDPPCSIDCRKDDGEGYTGNHPHEPNRYCEGASSPYPKILNSLLWIAPYCRPRVSHSLFRVALIVVPGKDPIYCSSKNRIVSLFGDTCIRCACFVPLLNFIHFHPGVYRGQVRVCSSPSEVSSELPPHPNRDHPTREQGHEKEHQCEDDLVDWVLLQLM